MSAKNAVTVDQLFNFIVMLKGRKTTLELFQERMESGLLADLLDPNAKLPERDVWRDVLSLPFFKEKLIDFDFTSFQSEEKIFSISTIPSWGLALSWFWPGEAI